jgi:hypothetical protein
LYPNNHGASRLVAGANFAQQFMGAADAQAIANVTWSLAQLNQHQQQQQHQRRQPDNANNVMLERLRNLVLNHLKHKTVAKMVLGGGVIRKQGDKRWILNPVRPSESRGFIFCFQSRSDRSEKNVR